MAKTAKSTKSIIDDITNRTLVSNKHVQSAVEIYNKEQDAKKSREIISCLEEIDNQEKRLLGNLQKIRAQEKVAIKQLKAANETRDQYLQDADWDKYANTINKLLYE